MQQTSDPKSDRAIDVAPSIEPVAAWRIREIEVIEHGRLRVTFNNRVEGEVDMRQLLESHRIDGTVLEVLRDPATFSKVSISLGALSWPNGADLAPDAMHDVIREEGSWQPR